MKNNLIALMNVTFLDINNLLPVSKQPNSFLEEDQTAKNLQLLHQQVYINLLHDYKGLSSVCTILNRKLKISHLRFEFLHKKASMKVAHIMHK